MTTLQKSIYCIALLSLSLTGCKKEEETPQAAELKPGELPPTQNPAFMNLDPNATPATAAAPAMTKTTAPTNAAPTATAPGMNPPHGQPGHRCEIPVGAPLDSKPSGTAPKQAQQQPVAQQPAPFMQPAARQQATAAQAAATTPTAPGMNPPHGQPGHRCDVAVGAPLP